jgi:hypothetical protein
MLLGRHCYAICAVVGCCRQARLAMLDSAAIAARGEEIKLNSAEFLWLCKGIRPPLLPNKVVVDPKLAAHLQERFRPATLRGK